MAARRQPELQSPGLRHARIESDLVAERVQFPRQIQDVKASARGDRNPQRLGHRHTFPLRLPLSHSLRRERQRPDLAFLNRSFFHQSAKMVAALASLGVRPSSFIITWEVSLARSAVASLDTKHRAHPQSSTATRRPPRGRELRRPSRLNLDASTTKRRGLTQAIRNPFFVAHEHDVSRFERPSFHDTPFERQVLHALEPE